LRGSRRKAVATYDLTQAQQDALRESLERAENEQEGVLIYQQNLTDGTARRNDAYARSESGLGAVGIVTGEINEIHLQLDSDRVWTGRIHVNEPVPPPS
jgi:hypothetical protein